MKILFVMILVSFSAIANDGVYSFAKSDTCKACHTQIFDEFFSSMHANSTPQKDMIHNAVWSKHPQNVKQNRYGCGKCHTPAADNLDKMMAKGQQAIPMQDNETHQAGISCAYCHRIKSIQLHQKSNINVISSAEKHYFGTRDSGVTSPYHEIIKTDNEHFKNGNLCIGCHSHKQNKSGLNVCTTEIQNTEGGPNCVSCHMPKVKGGVSQISTTKTHVFHGFSGAHNHSNLLQQYVDLSLYIHSNHFLVMVENQASHAFLLHPLRVAVLKVRIVRGEKLMPQKNELFVRVIGKDGKPAMPWVANTTLKDSMLKAKEKRAVKYNVSLQKGDKVEVVLGYYLVNPKALKPLKLQNEKVATEFHLFKQQVFEF
ncbi:MAG: hypothetical protein HOM11_11415 [Methylococcales bacterium]|jgi:hypothetical protein|nr:hypothetical protein [Methylococcales bacterium]MBT7445703.1 hypothetical protein [Methylococcales bacterium]